MNNVNILFAAVGRRVSLLRRFRQAMNELDLNGHIVAGDAGLSAPASYVADKRVRLLRVDDPGYISSLLDECRAHDIKLVISLIDSDLVLLSQHVSEFEEEGVKLLVCDEKTNRICFDKKASYDFFCRNNIPTPKVYSESEIDRLTDHELPVIVKPWDGSCSIGVNVASTMTELQFYRTHTPHAMVQSLVTGEEFTCDVYVDFFGKVRCVVPRKRLETRAGEVSKGLTVRDPVLIDAVIDCVEKLPHAIGCITVQCFQSSDGSVSFIEVNPRFGGGHPLSIEAGANFPKWVLQELVSGECDASQDAWVSDLAMLRYDDEVFVQGRCIR